MGFHSSLMKRADGGAQVLHFHVPNAVVFNGEVARRLQHGGGDQAVALLLQLAAEWGLVAAALIAGLASWAFLKWTTAARRAEDAQENVLLRVSLTGSMIAGATHSLVSGVIVMPLSQTALALVCGWALACYRSGTALAGAVRNDDHQARRWTGGIILSSAVVALVSMTAYDARHLHGDSSWQQEPVPFRAQPRFWQQKMPSSRPADDARAQIVRACVRGPESATK